MERGRRPSRDFRLDCWNDGARLSLPTRDRTGLHDGHVMFAVAHPRRSLPLFFSDAHATRLPRQQPAKQRQRACLPGWIDVAVIVRCLCPPLAAGQPGWRHAGALRRLARSDPVAGRVAASRITPGGRCCGCSSPFLRRRCFLPLCMATSPPSRASARLVMLPVIDILQSVPVLAFLSITVTGFIALFPGSLLGRGMRLHLRHLYLAGLEHDLRFLPFSGHDPAGVAGRPRSVYRLNRWQRFGTVELPSSAIGLMWNSMMSFGGGWFFVAASEAITVPMLNRNVKLPGLGSYMAAAVEAGDTARGRLRHRGDGDDHRGHRPTAVASPGGVGREIQAGTNRVCGHAILLGARPAPEARSCLPGCPRTSGNRPGRALGRFFPRIGTELSSAVGARDAVAVAAA